MFLIANTFAICFNKDYLTYLLTYYLVPFPRWTAISVENRQFFPPRPCRPI